MNGTVPVPAFVPEEISAFFSIDRDFDHDSDRDIDRWEMGRNHVIIALKTGTVPMNVPISTNHCPDECPYLLKRTQKSQEHYLGFLRSYPVPTLS